MSNKKRILWITRTAIFIAMIIVIQFVTRPLGTLVTGSLVNLILIVAAMAGGISGGLVVAVLSPAFAMLIGIGPMWALIPFIALGNCALILLWYFICKRAFKEKPAGYIIALVAGAVGKLLVLYLTIVRLMIPLFLNLPAKQAAAISATFSFPQLFTALIGGFVAVLLLPVVRKAISSRNS